MKVLAMASAVQIVVLLVVFVALVVLGAYLLLRGPESTGPSGKALCRQCGHLFDNTAPASTAAMHAWREWGLILCPTCAGKKGEI